MYVYIFIKTSSRCGLQMTCFPKCICLSRLKDLKTYKTWHVMSPPQKKTLKRS